MAGMLNDAVNFATVLPWLPSISFASLICTRGMTFTLSLRACKMSGNSL